MSLASEAAALAREEPRPTEHALEPDLPIIDAHHHLWAVSSSFRAGHRPTDDDLTDLDRLGLRIPRYLLEDFLRDTDSGHNIVATVFAQARVMYPQLGPESMAPVGETEFVNGVAAMSASGDYGPTRVCEGIVGFADLSLGEAVQEVLEAHIRVGNGRFKGIRQSSAWDPDTSSRRIPSIGPARLLFDETFRRGFARLAPLDLSFDAWMFEPQLPDLVDLARAFPETTIILDHMGTPARIGASVNARAEVFPRWQTSIRTLAELPNLVVKLGGFGMDFLGFGLEPPHPARSSIEIAELYRPFVETCIEAFAPNRCMFESNFPVDSGASSYATLWNVFKRITSAATADEKSDLFYRTAQRTYNLGAVNG